MINIRDIQARLKKMYDKSGKTQLEISRESGVSQSYINDLLSGKSSTENMSIKKLNQLFPEATISFDGGGEDRDLDDLTRHMLTKWKELSIEARCRIIAYMSELDTAVPVRKKTPVLHRITRMGNPSRNVVSCPVCRRKITVPASIEQGARFSCPDCGQHIELG